MRRGNKSHKVPNVKLRPAPPPTRTARVQDQDVSYDHSSDFEIPPNASMVDFCPKPFKGFTICATGRMDKPTLFKMAFELGAMSTNDLTDRVTHLIADSHTGAKYTCALELKIPIMTPDWITEAHAVWLRGDDVDVEQDVTKYRLPIFSGVILCLSGIDDVQRRTEINRLVTKHQGIYLKDLERPVRVTHLLCSGDIETDKRKYAEKFNKRKEANIHLVWEEWFWDSLEFGGRFDEKKYQVSRPRPERKSLPGNLVPPLQVDDSVPSSHQNSTISMEDVRQAKQSKPMIPVGSFTVINNLPTDGEEEEMAIINKPVAAVTLQLWQNLLKPRGFELEGGKLVRSPSKSQGTRSSPSATTRPQERPSMANRKKTGVEQGKDREKESVISSFRRANSFVPMKELAVRQPFRRNTCPLLCPGEAEGSGVHDSIQPAGSAMPTLFVGCTFRLLGEARCPNVRLAIENGGGIVTDDDAEEPTFIIVRLISGSKLYRDEFDDQARTKYRTECWLEHSVFHERICEPNENVSFTPLTISMPVPDAEKIKLSLSGLDQSELCWIRRLVRAIGITLEPTFSRRSTHLLCPCGTGAKFDKALEWRIPVVSLAWLEDIARRESILPVDQYIVGGSHTGPCIDTEDGLDYAPRPDTTLEIRRDKGKGKEKEVDDQMVDITNGNCILAAASVVPYSFLPSDGSSNQPMFPKNAALLQDTVPRDWDHPQGGKMLETTSAARYGLFGKPRFLTHDSDPPEGDAAHDGLPTIPSSPASPPQSSSPPTIEAELPVPAPTPPVPIPLPTYVTPTRQSVGSNHDIGANVQAQDPNQLQARVPSSTSPSPMKLPPSSIPNAFTSSSPAGIPETDAIARALHESLTTLLGKRAIGVADEETKGVGRAGGAKRGKRARPGAPSNMVSRDASRESVFSPPRPIFRPPHQPMELDNMMLLDGLDTGGPRSTEESLRVVYEDPEQAAEKRRLLRMLGGNDADIGTSEGVAVRDAIARPDGAGRTRRTKRQKVPGF
ncbi:hypothetical protein JVU11DRAFT_9012 [Chiua virens]|nr:hypothetical protein JVU11DRAFT_9012 [Chiua virens]